MKLLIKKANFIGENLEIIRNKDILVNSGKIVQIQTKINERHAKIIDGKKFLVTPGFVNAHYHLGETIFNNYAPTKSLEDYIKYTNMMSKYFKLEDHYFISQVSLIEAIKNGTTAISCARGWEAVKKSGIRGSLGYPIMNSRKLSSYYSCFEKQYPLITKQFTIKFNTGNPQIEVGLWLNSIRFTDEGIIKKVSKEFIKNKKVRFSIHVSETKKQALENRKRFGISEIEYLNKLKLLNNRTNLVQCNFLTDKDLQIIKSKKANITICPVSNNVLNTKLPNVKKILKRGINISLGTDSLATGISASLLYSANYFSNIYRDIDLKQIYRMITTNPARTIGFENIGTIKQGYYADLNFFRFKNSFLTDKKFLLKLNRPEIVMVDGKILLKNEKIRTINEKKVIIIFKKLKNIMEKYGKV